jgi:thiosulfate dehydrogenase
MQVQAVDSADCWTGAGPNQIPADKNGREIRYGRDLVANTAYYFGPEGIIAHSSNGMNCQNCHLDAGTKPWGNNYGAVASTYPKFRERSGSIETIEKRVNDCFERSLNGSAIDKQPGNESDRRLHKMAGQRSAERKQA